MACGLRQSWISNRIVSIVGPVGIPCVPHISESSLEESTIILTLIGEIDDTTLTIAHTCSHRILTGHVGVALDVWSSALTRIMQKRHPLNIIIYFFCILVYRQTITICLTCNNTLGSYIRRVIGIIGHISHSREGIHMAFWRCSCQHVNILDICLPIESITFNFLDI